MDSVFSRMYESDVKGGHPSIGPQQLIRALLLQVLYSIRGERMLTEQISYNRLFHWFVGLAMDEAVCDHSTKSDDDSPPDGGAGSHEHWHGEKRSNDTHEFSPDSQARLFRKSRAMGAMLCYMGHVLTDSRHGLVFNHR
ncbi:hypothetical protein QF000_000046 [Paraburkholderia atlantica]|uniref:Transposase InsH N-terminal domain-containing protein n=2 Tax=Paraburkholderia TaxID=1822464 RepID=A0A7W8LEV2_9BURK|nr:hypothetical protein [Paraburkholderia youngii]MBB5421337.1 hypothetical protein [Paraburkholderia atlantica]MBB5429544.1 hypothetical protein [Paraburkholderia atlantica]